MSNVRQGLDNGGGIEIALSESAKEAEHKANL
jgi:hypothetical protein